MTNLHLEFLYPLLLLLLIPAIGLALWFYFRLSKKYRRTRNRIISLVLSVIIACMSISLLAGVSFAYQKPVSTNEVILLVDISHSNKASKEKKDEFIKNAIESCDSLFKLGIVTFGYEQYYAVPLTDDKDGLFEKYQNAATPDDSATDIAAALLFTKELFSNKKTAKIVLISDGEQTDGDALSAIMTVVSEKIKVDTVYFSEHFGNDVQINSIIAPNFNILPMESVKIGVEIQSSYSGLVSLTLIDNGTEYATLPISLSPGVETYYMQHTFTEGAHEICFKLDSGNSVNDTIKQNNSYISYFFIQKFDSILIVDGGDESDSLAALIGSEYDVEVTQIKDVPTDLTALAEYDQLILMNVAYEDMPEGFESTLNSYVYDIGGGLLTVGGDKAYDKADMAQSHYYKQMLPVECIEYTPPLALMIVLDRSGSMDWPAGGSKTRMALAKEGIMACLDVLSERDYVGIISFSDEARMDLPLTSVPNRTKIINAAAGIEPAGSTVYKSAILSAGAALQAFNRVDRKHILFISDGEPQDKDFITDIERYYNETGITLSTIAFGDEEIIGSQLMYDMADAGGGRHYPVHDIQSLAREMEKELKVKEIKGPMEEPFTPVLRDNSPEIAGLIGSVMPELYGFNGTKPKPNILTPLAYKGYDTPIYAKWQYGKGKVGSFLSDLNGTWSSEFLTDSVGITFINNVIKGLFPLESIRIKDISVDLVPNNYTTQVIIDTPLDEGDTIAVTVTAPVNPASGISEVQNIIAELSSGFPRCVYNLYLPGVYEIKVQKLDASNNPKGEAEYFYQAFSYSAEFDMFTKNDDGLGFLQNLSSRSGGRVLTSAGDIYREFTRKTDENYDPRLLFSVLVIILFLLDVAVRKFKFKWPWEIIKERKIKKKLLGRT